MHLVYAPGITFYPWQTCNRCAGIKFQKIQTIQKKFKIFWNCKNLNNMKNYVYMIFWLFDHTWNLLNSHRNGDFPLGHPSSKCSGPSTLNFQVPFAWTISTPIIPYCYYYPFNPYKPYICECGSVCMWVSEYEYVCMWVCECEYVCVCVRVREYECVCKNLIKI
jgi:hypothetical protein